MKFKLIVAMVENVQTDVLLDAARDAGATGSTVITSARGEGLKPSKSFLGLELTGQRDVVLLLVEEHLSRAILEHIADVCAFDAAPGSGIAFQLDIEDAVGLSTQIGTISSEIEDQL